MKFFSILVVGASLLWGAVYALSGHIATEPTREHEAMLRSERAKNAGGESSSQGSQQDPSTQGHSDQASLATAPEKLSPETATILQSAADSPDDVAAQLAAADALLAESEEKKHSELLMGAITFYTKTLSLDPKNERALRTMGDLSFDVGMYDRAAQYFGRYLEINPSDTKTIVDRGLSLLGAQKGEEALAILQEAGNEFPDEFPIRLSIALTYQKLGRSTEAREAAEHAMKIVPDDTAKAVVTALLEQVSSPAIENADAQTTSPHGPTVQVSTADALTPSPSSFKTAALEDPNSNNDGLTTLSVKIEEFLHSHQILGPRIVTIAWPSPSTVEVIVRNFPLAAMPEVAQQRLRGRLAELVQGEGATPFTVKIVESENQQSSLVYDF